MLANHLQEAGSELVDDGRYKNKCYRITFRVCANSVVACAFHFSMFFSVARQPTRRPLYMDN